MFPWFWWAPLSITWAPRYPWSHAEYGDWSLVRDTFVELVRTLEGTKSHRITTLGALAAQPEVAEAFKLSETIGMLKGVIALLPRGTH
ncbi:MAG: hypothetical protein ACM31D_12745 [Bacteroidota bacterium]